MHAFDIIDNDIDNAIDIIDCFKTSINYQT